MIASDIQSLSPGAIVDLFVLDLTAIGGTDVLRFHSGVNALGQDVVWQGETYTRFPVEADGFGRAGQGAHPRPMLRIANVNGLIGAAAREWQDLVGARLTRKRTFVKYLDAVNFPGGVNPEADPNCGFSDDVWFVDRKAVENSLYIEWELATAFDVSGVMLPRRQCVQNVCPAEVVYRGPECGYSGGPVADRNDQPTASLDVDACGKRLSSCRLRFGTFAELPFGGFPGVGLVR